MINDLRSQGYRFASVNDFLGSTEVRRTRSTFLRPGIICRTACCATGKPSADCRSSATRSARSSWKTATWCSTFERARFEWHPGAWPSHYDILLGRLGVELTAGRQNQAPFRPIQASSDANCTYFPATGHRLCFGFREYWNSHGGLAIFGYPISEEFVENGFVVQYFERQRFEYHPNNPPEWRVLGGLLGTQRFDQLY